MDDDRHIGTQDESGRAGLRVFIIVFIVGLLVIAVVNRLFELGPTPGNILFVALPLVAATVAALRLHHHK